MTTTPASKVVRAPVAPKVNSLGLEKTEYKGSNSTLCNGCGHDSISARIVNVVWEMGLDQTQVIKLSGIGCSSKTPAYFLGYSHAFNGVHGRMPSLATGAIAANRSLKAIGISGDGDTASIGIGQFIHAMRRGVNMVYIVENNGVYGLTKGQFSATADQGSVSKKGVVNADSSIDLIGIALQLGATYVARSFSGDKKQLVPLIKGAILHQGPAFLDVISPCVAFNNHAGSTKSYEYVREHNDAVNRMDVIPERSEIEVDFDAGQTVEVAQHDGSILRLHKLEDDYDPCDRIAARNYIGQHHARGEVVTGLLYVDPEPADLHSHLGTIAEPLNRLGASELSPGQAALDKINARLR